MTKKESLEEYFNEKSEQIDENTFKINDREYLVLTDEEADLKTKEYILDSVWTFRIDFLFNHFAIKDNRDNRKCIEVLQELCESSNDLITSLIEDLDKFVEDAIESDGRGDFLSGYDGKELYDKNYNFYRI